jgi:putative flippase GtrA
MSTYNKKDFYIVTVIGFLVGWLVLLPVKNFGFSITPLLIAGLVIGLSIFAPIALFVLKLLGKFWPVFEQFGKFAAVGTLNTLIDLGVLNFLILLTDISVGSTYSGFKAISFLIATTNSYLWNKFWTFQSPTPVTGKEYVKFLGLTLIATAINVSIASLIVNVIGAPDGVNLKLWANIGALIGVFVSFILNFLNYRFIVFKNSAQGSETKSI